MIAPPSNRPAYAAGPQANPSTAQQTFYPQPPLPAVLLPYRLNCRTDWRFAQIRNDLANTEGWPLRRWLCWQRLEWHLDTLRAELADQGWPDTALPPDREDFAEQAPSLEVCRQRWAEAIRVWLWQTGRLG